MTEAPSKPVSLMDLVEELAAERNWTDQTHRHYKSVVRHLELWRGRTVYAHEFHRDWVNEFLIDIEGSKFSQATTRTRKVHVICLWNAAFESELCEQKPRKIRRVREFRLAPEAWLYNEVNKLVRVASEVEGREAIFDEAGETLKVITKAQFWRLWIRVLWDTGLRPCDVLELKRTEVKPDGMIVMMQQKIRCWHVCKLHPSTVVLINEIRLEPHWPLIPWSKSTEMLRREFKRIIVKAGLIGTSKKLRKSSASDVESRFPGMGGIHLGHRLGQSVAHNHYLDPRIVAKGRPMPTELTGDLATLDIAREAG